MPSIASVPGEVFYHFSTKNQSVDDLIRELYSQPSQLAIQHFKAINSHLKNNRVLVGQMVVITPPNSQQCSLLEAELAEAAKIVDEKLARLSEEEARIIADNYQLLNNITSYGNAGFGATVVYFKTHVNNIKGILKQISDLYTKTYNQTASLNTPQFYQQRKALFARLDSTMNSFVGHAKMGFTFDQNRIKGSLGLNTKSILHQWKRQPGPVVDVSGFAKNYANVARLSGTLKGAGYVGIALDAGQSAIKIHQACTVGTDQQCAKTSFAEGGRLVGSVGGGYYSGLGAAYLTCNLAFGIQTFGTSLLWCGIVAGSLGGYFGGKYVGNATEYSSGLIYENVIK